MPAIQFVLVACSPMEAGELPSDGAAGGWEDTGHPDTGRGTSGDSGVDSGPDTGPDVVDEDKDGSPLPDDCDDGDPLVAPTFDEIARDAIDNDCDGIVDLDSGSLADVSAYVEGANVSDRDFPNASYLGTTVRTAPDIDGDGGLDLLLGAGEHEIHLVSGSVVHGSGVFAGVREVAMLSFSSTDGTSGLVSADVGADVDGDGCDDIWFAERDDEAQRLVLAPCSSVVAGVSDLARSSTAAIVADSRSPTLEAGAWTVEPDLDGDGLQDVCTVAAINPVAPGAWGLCCITGASVGAGTELQGCDDAEGQVTSDLVVIARETDGVGDLDGDGYDDLLAQGSTSLHVFHGPDLVTGHHAEGSTLAAASIVANTYANGVATLANPDSDRSSLIVLTGDSYDEAKPNNASVVTVWSRLDGGAVFEISDSDVSLFYDSGSVWSELDAMSNVGALSSAAGALIVSTWESSEESALVEVSEEELRSGADANLAMAANRLDAAGILLALNGYGSQRWALLLADLDGDADDDIVAANPLAHAGFDDAANAGNWPAGIVTIIRNPR